MLRAKITAMKGTYVFEGEKKFDGKVGRKNIKNSFQINKIE